MTHTRESVLKDVIALLTAAFQPDDPITAESSIEGLGLDELDLLEVSLELEVTYGVSEEGCGSSRSWTSVQDIVNTFSKLLNLP